MDGFSDDDWLEQAVRDLNLIRVSSEDGEEFFHGGGAIQNCWTLIKKAAVHTKEHATACIRCGIAFVKNYARAIGYTLYYKSLSKLTGHNSTHFVNSFRYTRNVSLVVTPRGLQCLETWNSVDKQRPNFAVWDGGKSNQQYVHSLEAFLRRAYRN